MTSDQQINEAVYDYISYTEWWVNSRRLPLTNIEAEKFIETCQEKLLKIKLLSQNKINTQTNP